ncbi:hypothetical protein ACJO2E_08655 [Marinobacter sp. M1N3S26]|uniref:hypothetical protein n=1 Tax=Marinobacter sp. M1N3S26 TaxID=3382299 RepID=UPI00387AEC49
MDVTAVLDQFRSLGLIVDSLDSSGKIVRVPVDYPRADRGGKKSGWYVVHEFRLSSGAIGFAGAYGNHKLPDVESQTIGVDARQLTEADRQEYERKRKAAAQQVRDDARKAADECATRAREIWGKMSDSGTSAYLDRKGVRAYGLKFGRGKVVVPVYHARPGEDTDALGLALVGLQFIDGDGNKKFLTGTPKKGAFHWLGAVPSDPSLTWEHNSTVLVAEGYATGASLHMATGLPVAVAFDAGNLAPVVTALRSCLPHATFCIACDDDRDTEGNPGLSKGRAAAQAVGGVFVLPQFEEPAREPD